MRTVRLIIGMIGVLLFQNMVLSESAYSVYFKGVDGIVRLYGSVGYGNALEAENTSQFSHSTGWQFLFVSGEELFYVGAGLDTSYRHFGEYNTISSGSVDSNYLHTLVVGEVHLLLFNVQLGVGPAFAVGDMTGTSLALMSAIGFNMPFYPVGLSAMARTDWVFDRETAGSVSLMLALTIPLRF